MTRIASADTVTVKKSELRAMLREVVREELHRILMHAEPWQFDPKSPLYQALLEIRQEVQVGHKRLLTDKEVWGQ